MQPVIEGALFTLAAYLGGAIPFGYLVARAVRGIDIREHGSGNIGATNVGRVLGSKWGLFVLACDLCKGLAPVAIVRWARIGDEVQAVDWEVLAGVAAIAGHIYPVWLGFRGGKGVATALGVVLCLAPPASLVAAAVFAVAFGIWKIVSLAAIGAALSFAASQFLWFLPQPFSDAQLGLSAFSLIVPLWIVFRHRENIRRLVRGEEKPYRTGKGDQPQTPA